MAATVFVAGEERTYVHSLKSAGINVEDVGQNSSGWFLECRANTLQLCREGQRPFNLSTHDIARKISGGRSTLLARACGARPGLRVLDAMGGWGTDGMLLAALGCEVDITENNPWVYALASNLARELASPANVLFADANQWFQQHRDRYDVVYVDPMFPPHPKNAKPARKMQILEELAPFEDATDFVNGARSHALERVVVKSRLKQKPFLEAPDWQIRGRSVRFDVYRRRA